MFAYKRKNLRTPYKIVGMALVLLFLITFRVAAQEEGEETEIPYPEVEDPVLPELVASLAWRPDGQQIAAGIGPDRCNQNNNDYSIRIIDAASNTVVKKLPFPNCTVTSLSWDVTGTYLVSSAMVDLRAIVWDVDNNDIISQFGELNTFEAIISRWNPVDNRIASVAYQDPYLVIWDALTGETLLTFKVDSPHDFAWSPDGRQLAIGSTDITVWDAADGRLAAQFPANGVAHIGWSPDGKQLATINENNSISLWDAVDGALLLTIEGDAERINTLAWHPDSQLFAAGSDAGSIQVWDALTGQVAEVIPGDNPIYAVDWSPDGQKLAYGGAEGTVTIAPISLP